MTYDDHRKNVFSFNWCPLHTGHPQSTRGYMVHNSVACPPVRLNPDSYLPGSRAVSPAVTPTTIPVRSWLVTTIPVRSFCDTTFARSVPFSVEDPCRSCAGDGSAFGAGGRVSG